MYISIDDMYYGLLPSLHLPHNIEQFLSYIKLLLIMSVNEAIDQKIISLNLFK
jgi:hypothetical protein